MCDRIAVMYLGKIVELGRQRRALRHPRHPTPARCSRPCRCPTRASRAAPARGAGRRRAEPDEPAARLPLPPALPEGPGDLLAGGAAARAQGRRHDRRLPLPAHAGRGCGAGCNRLTGTEPSRRPSWCLTISTLQGAWCEILSGTLPSRKRFAPSCPCCRPRSGRRLALRRRRGAHPRGRPCARGVARRRRVACIDARRLPRGPRRPARPGRPSSSPLRGARPRSRTPEAAHRRSRCGASRRRLSRARTACRSAWVAVSEPSVPTTIDFTRAAPDPRLRGRANVGDLARDALRIVLHQEVARRRRARPSSAPGSSFLNR